jgi:opacity protein-like surface antigen
MNRKLIPLLVVVASALATSLAITQSSEDQASGGIEPPPKTDPSLNRFRLGGRLSYNISARLESIGIAPTQTNPQPRPPRDPAREFVSATGVNYRDGYVGIDISGNAPDPGNPAGPTLTHYWGYANDSQLVGLDLFLSYSSAGTLFEDINNDPQPGLELGYARQLGEKEGTKYGIEAAFTYLNLSFRASGVADPNVLGIHAFTFPPGVQVVPQAPFRGSFEGPVPPEAVYPLLGDTPTYHPVRVASQFDAALYGLKLGPYLEFPLSQRLSFLLSGGFALHFAESDFAIHESAATGVPGTVAINISDSELSVLPGGYISGRLSAAVTDSLSVFAGLEYEGTGKHSQRLADKRIEIDFWNSVFLSFGASYSF